MERIGKSNLFKGIVDGHEQIFNVVGTYGDKRVPIVRVEEGKDEGKAFAINPETGAILKQIYYKN